MTTTTPVVDVIVPVADKPTSAVSWAAIIAGAIAAGAVTIVLLALGSGLGVAAAAPFARTSSPATFGAMTAIWLVLTQWLSAGLGGYLAGRLRTRWAGTHTHEVFFRDTAHGFLTWALATVVVALVTAPALAGAASEAAHATAATVTTVTAADADAARRAASAVSIYTALSMVVGAFIGSVAAAIGGHERDQHP